MYKDLIFRARVTLFKYLLEGFTLFLFLSWTSQNSPKENRNHCMFIRKSKNIEEFFRWFVLVQLLFLDDKMFIQFLNSSFHKIVLFHLFPAQKVLNDVKKPMIKLHWKKILCLILQHLIFKRTLQSFTKGKLWNHTKIINVIIKLNDSIPIPFSVQLTSNPSRN